MYHPERKQEPADSQERAIYDDAYRAAARVHVVMPWIADPVVFAAVVTDISAKGSADAVNTAINNWLFDNGYCW